MTSKPLLVDLGSSTIKYTQMRETTEIQQIYSIYPTNKPQIQLAEVPLTTRCRLSTPFSRGILVAHDALPMDFTERLESRNVYMTIEPLMPSVYAAKLTEFLFEQLNVNSLFLTNQLAASAMNTDFNVANYPAIVAIDLGYQQCTCAVLVFGQVVEYSVRRTDAGGMALDEALKENVADESIFGQLGDFQYLREELRKLLMNGCADGYISISENNMRLEPCKSETRPFFKVLGHEQTGLVQGIFEPDKVGIPQKGICDLVRDSLSSVAPAVSNIAREVLVVSGGLARSIRVRELLNERLVKTGTIGKILCQKDSEMTTIRGLDVISRHTPTVSKDLYYEYGKEVFYKRFM